MRCDQVQIELLKQVLVVLLAAEGGEPFLMLLCVFAQIRLLLLQALRLVSQGVKRVCSLHVMNLSSMQLKPSKKDVLKQSLRSVGDCASGSGM